MLTKLFACGKPMKIIQICKIPGKQNIISYISENDFINFFVVSKSMNYLKNALGSIYKSIAAANIPTKIEMNILVTFEVTQISSFSECQVISSSIYRSIFLFYVGMVDQFVFIF